MKVREYAKLISVTPRTIRRWIANGTMPVPFTRTKTNTIIIHASETVEDRLEKQIEALQAENDKLKADKDG